MVSNYTIISIDDSRKKNKASIRQIMRNHEEIVADEIDFIDGRLDIGLSRMREKYGDIEPKGWSLARGELGVWYSQLNAWTWAAKHGDLIIFEDDAIVSEDFDEIMWPMKQELPADYDVFALFVPDNQLQDFGYDVVYDVGGAPQDVGIGQERYRYDIDGNFYVTRAYQGYSCVANMISQAGAKRMLELVRRYGIYSTVDCFIFLEAHRGNLRAFAHHPQRRRPVTINWDAPTLIHSPEFL